jgi:cellulose synthase/poly-beta-1,6-N-acetylglucosamine synthase-like glycosyltransferase
LVAAVERRAEATGVGADRVLIAAGVMDEEEYLLALSQSLGLGYETLEDCARDACPLDDLQLAEAAKTGLLLLRGGDGHVFVVAPRSVRYLVDYAADNPALNFRLTSQARLNAFIARSNRAFMGHHAAEALNDTLPDLSAASRHPRRWLWLAATAFAISAVITFSEPALMAAEIMLSATFLAWLLLRLIGSSIAKPVQAVQRIPDAELPIYTIIAALYREAGSVQQLVTSIRQLDYPPEKLDIKIVIEPDDLETGLALALLDLAAPFEVITAPASGPRTKPKALNAALAFARGTFTVIYDAEDRPEPNQLRMALDRFQSGGDELACVQSCLTIDNTDDGWLARLFTAEYAAQFDLFLPGLARLHLPLPLGGSSNHFRTEVLREVGAWDSYNVTEDADLGTRLARFGYRCEVIASTTYEEAPATLRRWIPQRTRWFKGWLQTWAVHMRTPGRLLRELGLTGFLSFQLVVGGNVLSALVHPVFLASLIYSLTAGRSVFSLESFSDAVLTSFYATTLAAGYVSSFVLGPARACATRPDARRVGARVRARALAAAVVRRLARALPVRTQSLPLGKDRAWAGPQLTSCKAHQRRYLAGRVPRSITGWMSLRAATS